VSLINFMQDVQKHSMNHLETYGPMKAFIDLTRVFFFFQAKWLTTLQSVFQLKVNCKFLR